MQQISKEELTIFPILQNVPPQELKTFASYLSAKTFCEGEYLLTQNNHGQSVYFLCSGAVEIYIEEDGEMTSVGMRWPGEMLGEINAIDGLGHSAHVVAREPCRVLAMSVTNFEICMNAMPRFSANIARVLAGRVRFLTTRAGQMKGDASERVCAELLRLAEHYRKDGQNEVVIPLRITQSSLSAMTNLSRQQVNKVLRQLGERGLLSTDSRRRITIHDYKRFQDEQ